MDAFNMMESDMEKFSSFLHHHNVQDKDLILLIDKDYNIWELIKREDLKDNIKSNEDLKKIESFGYFLNAMGYIKKTEVIINDIENNESIESLIDNSGLDISKDTEWNNVSHLIKETNNDISGIYN